MTTTPLQVAFLTGQSDPRTCALSRTQTAFLDGLPVPAPARVRSNFPYVSGSATAAHTRLWRASWNNTRQYFASRTTAFAEMHRPPVSRMIARAEHTVLLAGSCGLELLANLHLSDGELERLHVFAYGAVARSRPTCETLAVCGRRDWIARAWREPTDVIVDCTHLTYLETPHVLSLCSAFVQSVESAVGAPV